MELEGKVAVITGAATGIGRATAELFAREGAGVVVADLNENGGRETVRRIRSSGREAVFCRVDVSKSEMVQEMIRVALDSYGQLDILFNNAGIALLGRDSKVTELAEEDWDKVLAVNLKGVYLGMKYALPHLLERGEGAIINNASIAGLVGFPNLAAYCASKGGIIQLTRATALDYGPQGIRVNAISPGVIRTPMTEELLGDPQSRAGLEQGTIIGRLGEPEDIARAVLYLASGASSFVTGSVLVIDGGWTVQ